MRPNSLHQRLALPYLYDYLKNPISMHAMVQQLKNRPDLGSFIRSILCPGFYYSPDTMLTLVSYATNAQVVSAPFAVYPDCFEALAKTTGSSLRELTICFENCQINTSLFTHFPELCTLELGTTRVTFHCDSTPEDVLSKLHTIHVNYLSYNLTFLDTFSMIRQGSMLRHCFTRPTTWLR